MTQADLDEIFNTTFSTYRDGGIYELSGGEGTTWRAFFGIASFAEGATPAEAIRKATLEIIARRLTK